MPDESALAARRLVPAPVNEPVKTYAQDSAERAELKARLREMTDEPVEVPVVIDGRPFRSRTTSELVIPCSHRESLGIWHHADGVLVRKAIQSGRRAWREWSRWPFADRAAVFLKAADLAATRWRATLNAATMLGQAKTVVQSEIDAACELVDFWRFNVAFAADLLAEQPLSSPGTWNQIDYRPLEGFVYAVTPFNFTAIAGNLPTAPVLMGGVSLWKPSAGAMLSAHVILQVLTEAGLPPGVINFVPGDPQTVTAAALADADFAGLHFTGSTAVFRALWREIGSQLDRYRSYPRIVGETGGKDFIVAHPSADVEALAVAIVRGAFEYQGQKCSAASRLYVPKSRWKAVRDRVVALMAELTMGDVRDFSNFSSAVIDRRAFDKIRGYQLEARRSARIIAGGSADDRHGYFIEPTFVQTTDPHHRLLREEIFGPMITAYVYDDRAWKATLSMVDKTSVYALTGAIFAQDRAAVREATIGLRHAAGNFYINDKPTGAVVGQQPFGGARASGTNDKAGSKLNLTRWISARVIKETFDPPRSPGYRAMEEP
jgi:1-pyrroline-5-carboxylate dehydrogenase